MYDNGNLTQEVMMTHTNQLLPRKSGITQAVQLWKNLSESGTCFEHRQTDIDMGKHRETAHKNYYLLTCRHQNDGVRFSSSNAADPCESSEVINEKTLDLFCS